MTAPELEELRHATLQELAARYPTAHLAPTIRRKVAESVMFPVPVEALDAALEFLREKNFVACERDGLGSSKFWKATAAGVQAQERGQF